MHKILVIETPSQDRADLVEYLKSEGFLIKTADDGPSGVQSGRTHRPDVILCSWALEGLHGHQVLDAVRQDGELKITPFILITEEPEGTLVARSHVRQAMEKGADDCLIRPVTHIEILNTITARINRQVAISELYVGPLRNTAERINRLNYYDSLTELPNYELLKHCLNRAITAARESQQTLAFMSVSIDRLQLVNTVLGYPAGDELLKAATWRMQSCLPTGATLARLTANQFAILLPELERSEQAKETAEDIIDALKRPFSLSGHDISGQDVFVTASIGIAFLLHQSKDFSTLLRQANAALESAKSQKSSHYQFYRSDMPLPFSNQIAMETWLRYALDRDEFEVYYQPQLNLANSKIEGTEALIRWEHPEHGYISPAKFVPLAEEMGLIVPIGQWVLETACSQAKLWLRQNIGIKYVSVNLSSVQFNQPNLIELIELTLTKVGLDPSQLELEVTETALMQDAKSAITTLTALKALGVRIAIDDFGTGYSSLSYLKQLPVDTLKVDNCFVRGAPHDVKNQAILQSTIELAHRLDLKVVAEGVEEAAEQRLLSQYQCDYLQGYWVGPPMPAANLEQALMVRLLQQASRSATFAV
ncbi:EAL domain-containing response regulator [cf. Phormidesmis sp. LEGE 11477]|uniref:GGDEF/EAL domain-containing response regulator n=1 Tax=cf. Phormidesmis sp. LEGE 11477 TaxID=1828680 RepID=UPI00187F733C|nr:EAL domain-containing response regulator [cf. Phormidesmis sp. LEGE 11477]MBE9062840.1 EAL domain-containing protein [cf. Phormidesmis sp. LEGE 11477]